MRNLKLNWGPIGVSLAIIVGVNQVLLGWYPNYGQEHHYVPPYPNYPQYGQGHNYPQHPHYPNHGQALPRLTNDQLIQLLRQLSPQDLQMVINGALDNHYPNYLQYGQGHNYPQYPHYPNYGQGSNGL